jgi:S-adenosylhomocysteine hydrolase
MSVSGLYFWKPLQRFSRSFSLDSRSVGGEDLAVPVLASLDLLSSGSTSLSSIAERTCLIGVQHYLPSTISLFQALRSLGFLPHHMLFAGKPYSTVPGVLKKLHLLGVDAKEDKCLDQVGNYHQYTTQKIDALWESCRKKLETDPSIDRIIILDEGGRCLERIPRSLLFKYPIIGIEQTRGGLYSSELPYRPFPIIQVASSAVKREFESRIIAASILRKLDKILSEENYQKMQYGIIGNGAIGKAIASHLTKKGCKILVYDQNQEACRSLAEDSCSLMAANSIEAVFRNADCIFGCTGRDITKEVDIFDLVSDKFLISCSSEDKEFQSALQSVLGFHRSKVLLNPLEDITLLSNSNDKIRILSGGFPINFDRTAICDPPEIELTRALLLSACIQALATLADVNYQKGDNTLMLNPKLQKFSVDHWAHTISLAPQQNILIQSEHFLEWITQHSSGTYRENSIVDKIVFKLGNKASSLRF